MIQLCTSEYCMEIDITDPDWCKCWLTKDENIIYLGAESLKYLKEHLLSGLDDNTQESMGRRESLNISWVLSLAKAHHVLYISIDTENKTLIWQATNSVGMPTYIMRLSRDQLLQWRYQLEGL
jgi:hypothetical protein